MSKDTEHSSPLLQQPQEQQPYEADEDIDRRRRPRLRGLALSLVGILAFFSIVHTISWVRPAEPTHELPSIDVDYAFKHTFAHRFTHHPDRLYQQFDGEGASIILKQAEDAGIIPRDTLHLAEQFNVPVITPEEFHILSKHGVTMQEIEDIANNNYFMYALVDIVCVGVQTRTHGKHGENTALFLRIFSTNYNNARADIETLYTTRARKAGDKKGAHLFSATNWSPHVAVAYTHPKGWTDERLASKDSKCAAKSHMVGDPW